MPKQTGLTVSYSASVKASLPHNQYENSTVTLIQSETWDVQDLTIDEAQSLWEERYQALRKNIGDRIIFEYNEITGNSE